MCPADGKQHRQHSASRHRRRHRPTAMGTRGPVSQPWQSHCAHDTRTHRRHCLPITEHLEPAAAAQCPPGTPHPPHQCFPLLPSSIPHAASAAASPGGRAEGGFSLQPPPTHCAERADPMQRDAAAAAHHPAAVPPARIHHCKRASGDALHCKQPSRAALSALLPSPRPTFAWGQPHGDVAPGPAAKDGDTGREHTVLASPQEPPQPLSSHSPCSPGPNRHHLIPFPSPKPLGLRSLSHTLGHNARRSVIPAMGPLSQRRSHRPHAVGFALNHSPEPSVAPPPAAPLPEPKAL